MLRYLDPPPLTLPTPHNNLLHILTDLFMMYIYHLKWITFVPFINLNLLLHTFSDSVRKFITWSFIYLILRIGQTLLGKQCRPTSEGAECSVQGLHSGFIHLGLTRIPWHFPDTNSNFPDITGAKHFMNLAKQIHQDQTSQLHQDEM